MKSTMMALAAILASLTGAEAGMDLRADNAWESVLSEGARAVLAAKPAPTASSYRSPAEEKADSGGVPPAVPVSAKPKDYPCGVAAATKAFEMKAAAANWELSEGSSELTLRLIDFSPQFSSRSDEFKYWITVHARGPVLDREFQGRPQLGIGEIVVRRGLNGWCEVVSAMNLE